MIYIYGHSLHLSSRRELGQKQNWAAALKAQKFKKKSAIAIFAMLAPCSEVTTQSLFVLVSCINDATAGTKLVEMLNLIAQYSSGLLQSY